MYDGHEAASTTSKVEVRMIDFAQSRIKSEETNYHIGPDQGYILGVKSLVDIFTEINQSIRNWLNRALGPLDRKTGFS